LRADGAISFLHGGSPFKVWQPDSFRIRLNRRSTFNYGWDILEFDYYFDFAVEQVSLMKALWGKEPPF
jgi:hypothetical protein